MDRGQVRVQAGDCRRSRPAWRIYQNCPVFNDGAFGALTDKGLAALNQIRLVAGERIVWPADDSDPPAQRCVARGPDGDLVIAGLGDVDESAIVVHEPGRENPGLAFALSRLSAHPNGPTPIGVFRDVQRPVFAADLPPAGTQDRGQVEALLRGGDTWTVS